MALQGGQGRPGTQETFKPVFSQEELRVLRECNRESFYFRSVPLATALSAAAFLAMRRGLLKPGARFGYTPKVIGAAALGYFVGKLSYQSACAEKLMLLPNSPLGEALRKRKGRMGFQETVGMEAGFTLGTTQPETDAAAGTEPIFDDHRPDQRDHNDSLHDYHRGVSQALSEYSGGDEGGDGSAPHTLTSYQELRRSNREEYVNKMAEKYRRPSPQGDFSQDTPLHAPPPPPSPSPPSLTAPRSLHKNQYGDDVYE